METIAVLGLGLIGGSLALALRQAHLAEHIAGYDVDPETTRQARERGAITQGYATAEEAIQQADLVIVATPIRAIPVLLAQIAPALKPGTLVTDTASTKQQVVQWATDVLPEHAVFVGGHPMAGRERSGIEAAERGLFAGCTYCLTPTKDTPSDAVTCLSDLITGLAAHPLIVEAQEHDRLVAGISHLPFVVSAALVRMLGQEERWPKMATLVAGGYRDMSRLAAGSPTMHRDMCGTNKEAIVHWLDRLVMQLAELRSLIVTGDDTLEHYFAQAKDIHDGRYGA
ncbi:MAG TPA: prephenate dehydrogenase/arogenate dehydrogenase family protein [Ktedonobacteraceae bacterium]